MKPASQWLSVTISYPAKENAMKNIKVLGTGCANCRATVALVESVAKEKGVDISIEKV